jgi:hypothetical protein
MAIADPTQAGVGSLVNVYLPDGTTERPGIVVNVVQANPAPVGTLVDVHLFTLGHRDADLVPEHDPSGGSDSQGAGISLGVLRFSVAYQPGSAGIAGTWHYPGY